MDDLSASYWDSTIISYVLWNIRQQRIEEREIWLDEMRARREDRKWREARRQDRQWQSARREYWEEINRRYAP